MAWKDMALAFCLGWIGMDIFLLDYYKGIVPCVIIIILLINSLVDSINKDAQQKDGE